MPFWVGIHLGIEDKKEVVEQSISMYPTKWVGFFFAIFSLPL
ncbi:MAG: hypothetical protein ACJAZR_002602 [Sediminicola sp.]|jgi:hypothetical protein